MLGWSPRHFLQNRTSPGRRCPSQSHDTARLHSFNDEKPVLQPPHKIVIGFDLGISNDKSLQPQAPESPRSVLDSNRPQSTSPRSPLSALGSLLTGATCVSTTDTEADTAASNVYAAHAVLGIEHSSCAVDKIGSDLLALFRYNTHTSSGASKDQRNEKHRERFKHRRCNSILRSDEEPDCTEDEVETPKSLFSTGPLCLDPSPRRDLGMDFLNNCFRCKRQLLEGKDVYMYRSDQAFCSQECRYHQIITGERKHGNPVVNPCISRVPHAIGSVARAILPTFA